MARGVQSIRKPETISRSPPERPSHDLYFVPRRSTHSRTCAQHGAFAASVTAVTLQTQAAAYLEPDTPMRRRTPALGDVP
jgi:hypothetical protein